MTATPTPSTGAPAATPATTPIPVRRKSHAKAAVGAIILAIVVVAAGYYYFELRPTTKTTAPLEEGGFAQGSPVTFVYNGTNTFLCRPGLLTFYPTATSAASTTPCEVGAANQSLILQYPEWVLVPAFAGLSIFGITSLGASSQGFPQFQSGAIQTDCGGGGSATACVDHPTNIYSPLFTSVEQFLNISTGVNGLPEGVLPTPAHDHLLNTSTTFPNVEWGTIVVLVMDPNIWPNRATGACTSTVASNLSSPTGNCLTSMSALENALWTHSTAVNGANHGNPIWQTLGAPTNQVIVPGDLTVATLNNLNSNLYIPFSVQPGAPASGYPT